MGTYILIQEDKNKPSTFRSKVDIAYNQIIKELEKSSELPSDKEYISSLKYDANMAYIEFNGEVNGESINFEGFAHSKISKKDWLGLRDPDFHKQLLKTFYTELHVNYYKDGYVNSLNDTLTYNNSMARKMFSNHWLRSTDAESRLIENLIVKCNNETIGSGHINIYTLFEPCLSCSGKIKEFLKNNLNVDINVYYDRKYGKRRSK